MLDKFWNTLADMPSLYPFDGDAVAQEERVMNALQEQEIEPSGDASQRRTAEQRFACCRKFLNIKDDKKRLSVRRSRIC